MSLVRAGQKATAFSRKNSREHPRKCYPAMIFLRNSKEPLPQSPEISKNFPQKLPEFPSKIPSAQNSSGMRRLFPRILLGPRPFSRPAQFSIFAAVTLLFLFSQTSFAPSPEVHGALKTIMGLSRAQMGILIKTTSGSRWPLRFQTAARQFQN